MTIAPSRKSTDGQLVARHAKPNPVQAWEPAQRAAFIVEKLEEGYTTETIKRDLGFTRSDIQKARQTRLIVEIARSLDVDTKVKAKLDRPKANLFSTIERILDSAAGRSFLKIAPSDDHGFVGKTSKNEFLKGFMQIVQDVALGKVNSRSLNTVKDIEGYLRSIPPDSSPKNKRDSFFPHELLPGGKSSVSPAEPPSKKPTQKQPEPDFKTTLPKYLRIGIESPRVIDLATELKRLNGEKFPNAGSIMLRVFFEIAAVEHLKRTGRYKPLVERLKKKKELRYGAPTLKQLVQPLLKEAEEKLTWGEFSAFQKAMRWDDKRSLNIDEINKWIHSPDDLPKHRDSQQFFLRIRRFLEVMVGELPEVDTE
ncbi:MAG: hypothetical protein R3E96_15990 [Planctomycetota bacterium]